jgi:hypothetical protein
MTKNPVDSKELLEKHSYIQTQLFRLKVNYFILKRFLINFKKPVIKFHKTFALKDEQVISESKSDLWNENDNEENWILTAGKIQNLRIAAQKLNGIEVSGKEIFSFWKHIGNPNIGKDYVVGREIREGCILPTKAGGLCQLSNALYDAALKANFEIIERHKHTRVVQGSLAEKDRDATVKWNYVDLRFRSNNDFRIEVELNSDQLIVRFKSKNSESYQKIDDETFTTFHKINDCFSCGNTSCFNHVERVNKTKNKNLTTFIVDDCWPEYDDYLQNKISDNDVIILPLKSNFLVKTKRYDWSSSNRIKNIIMWKSGLERALKIRFDSKNKNPFEFSLDLDEKLVKSMISKIPIESTHLVVSSNFLPFLEKYGALGGRTFDVLMSRLPFENLHQKLDLAFSKHSISKTLKDFRASNELIDFENKSLNKAQKIISPHFEVQKLFSKKAEIIPWVLPEITTNQSKGKKILYLGSSVGRKGAYEVKKLVTELNLNICFMGKILENENFWMDVAIEHFNGNWNEIGLILYPAYVENQPRQLLKAISRNIPVLISDACGISPTENIIVCETGNYDDLKQKFLAWQKVQTYIV